MEKIIFEHDRAWYSVVVGGIQKSVAWVEDVLQEEMLEWNAASRDGIKSFRLLCREDDLRGKTRCSLLIAFKEKEAFEQVIREGVFMFGE
jgi:hypothetical protein